MPDTRISKIKIRRGTDAQRRVVVFDQGELVSTTDTKRAFLGTGTLSGGEVIGSKNHTPLTNYYSLSNTNAEIGDIVVANNMMYQLTANNYTNVNSWANIGPKVDPIFFEYDTSNYVTLKTDSISASYIDSSTVSNGVKIENGILQSNFNTKSLEISSFQLSIKSGGIDERELNSTTLLSGGGLLGGSGSKLRIDIDPTYFIFNDNKLSLSAAPTTIEFSDLSSSWFGAGLNYSLGDEEITANLTTVNNTLVRSITGNIGINPSLFGSGLVFQSTTPTLSTTLVNVDNVSLVKTAAGVISMSASPALSGTNEWAQIKTDQFGRVINKQSSIYDVFIGDSTLSTQNSTNSLSSIFNGTPDYSINGAFNGAPLTIFTALSSDGVTVINLSSAGFIVFEGNINTRVAGSAVNQVGRFAMPIFAF